MSAVFKTFLSMSVSGSLLILVLFLGKGFLKDKISRQWQYYIWLIVIVRLLLPFGPEISLMGKAYQTVDKVAVRGDNGLDNPAGISKADSMAAGSPENVPDESSALSDMVSLLRSHAWVVWLAVFAGMLIRKITIYQSFQRYINSGLTPVSDIEILDRFSDVLKQTGINKPAELCVNPLIVSPLLLGFFHPCIVLPGTDIPEKDFRYIILHELMHYKRRDVFYKWLVQIAVCLHWFNPFVYFMSREITRACEFSCDEAVLVKTGFNHAGDYGKTLLDAMAAVGKYKESVGVVTLSEGGQLLKERLGAIMSYRKKSKVTVMATGILTLGIVLGAFFIGVYPVRAEMLSPAERKSAASAGAGINKESPSLQSGGRDVSSRQSEGKEDYAAQAEKYYKAGSLPLFEIVFSRMEEAAQGAWLSRIYEEDEVAFFSVSVNQLKIDSALIKSFAERTYTDSAIDFFSVLADRMSRETLETWLDRALEDKKTDFQSVVFNKLDMDKEWDLLKAEWEEQQLEEYRLQGITIEGEMYKTYYYKGEVVNVFLDVRQNKSFYTLNINPQGTVSIKVTRNEDGEIISVDYMTDEGVRELLEDKE